MKIDWQRLASVGICLTLGAVLFFISGKYLLAVFAPFIIAWLMATLTNSISAVICRRAKIPHKLCSAVILTLLFFAIGLALFLGITRFLSEIEKFISRLTSNSDILPQKMSELSDKLENIGSHIPLVREFKSHDKLSGLGDRLEEILTSFLIGLASDLGTAITSVAGAVFKTLPSIILFLVISIISSFYFALDLDSVNGWVRGLIPKGLLPKAGRLKKQAKHLVLRYVKAYSILMVLTFFEVFTGLSIIGVDYAFLLAGLISVLDVLPILGVGTVLLPWAVFSFFVHDFDRGIALVVLWAIVTVIRQIAEPKIVGETIGLHPIVTLIGMYVGFKLFSVVGMFLAPTAIICIKSCFSPLPTTDSGAPIDSKEKK